MSIHSLVKKIRFLLVSMMREILNYFDLKVLTNKQYKEILAQRAKAVKDLVDQKEDKLEAGLIGVIFSRDRALQLNALLESYFEKVINPAPLIVIYKASNFSHKVAYQEVIARIIKLSHLVVFIEQPESFRECLVNVLEGVKVKSIFFLVDDIVFIRHVDLSIYSAINSRMGILSLRLGPSLRKSYTTNQNQKPPFFLQSDISLELLEFEWFEQGCEWADPWSVDGNIYSAAEIFVLTKISQFKAPNSYEDALKSFSDLAKGRIGYCFKECKILNLAINRVQSERSNISGSITTEFLLEQWNRGLVMDRKIFDTHIPYSPHEEFEIKFRSRT